MKIAIDNYCDDFQTLANQLRATHLSASLSLPFLRTVHWTVRPLTAAPLAKLSHRTARESLSAETQKAPKLNSRGS